ncbi:MAG: DUF1499 domain-containing protein [Oscillochloris sp.]|nr:DUF1499 domain-containing protein [Oscillochloris sp.]
MIALNVVGLAIAARVVGEPATLGVHDGRLADCPASPNCVSTHANPDDREHYMAPLPLSGSAEAAAARIRAALAAEPKTAIVRDDGTYIHAVARSQLMDYPDDVEFLIDTNAGLIHFRSASRLGYGDGGVNRARMERITHANAP